MSPSLCVPPNRLKTLITQALAYQRQKCIYHNQDDSSGLLIDHHCDRQRFPNFTSHIFNEHQDEVWYMSFSHDGGRLASASRDARAIIWDVQKFELLSILDDHKKAVSYLCWSPDDKFLLTASNDHSLKLWDSRTGACIRTYSKHKEAITSCQFLPDGKSFISGSTERVVIHWDINGSVIYEWTGLRAMDLAVSSDGKILFVCTEKKIRLFNLTTKESMYDLQEQDAVTSIKLTKNNELMLVNLCISEIHLWDIKQKCIVKKYYGQKQGRFVIRSTLGGVGENFVLSGSEGNSMIIRRSSLRMASR